MKPAPSGGRPGPRLVRPPTPAPVQPGQAHERLPHAVADGARSTLTTATLRQAGQRRRRWLWGAAALVGAAGVSGLAWAQRQQLPLSTSLLAELAQALRTRQPLVVMVSLPGCPWCEQVRRNYLAPMQAQQGLPVVQIDMHGTRRTVSTGGQAITHDAQVRAWGVKVAPTVLFLGAQGQEVADRLVGGANDFYAAYLDRRLEQARKALPD